MSSGNSYVERPPPPAEAADEATRLIPNRDAKRDPTVVDRDGGPTVDDGAPLTIDTDKSHGAPIDATDGDAPSDRTAKTLLKEILALAGPNSVTVFFVITLNFANLIMVSRFEGIAALSAAGLGFMTMGFVAWSSICGMAAAIETLVGQYYGADPMHKNISLVVQQVTLMLVAWTAFVSVLMWFAGDVFSALHIGTEVENTKWFIRRLIPAVWGCALLEVPFDYLMAMNHVKETFIMATLQWLLNLAAGYFLIRTYGLVGSAATADVAYIAGGVILTLACLKTKSLTPSWQPWSWERLRRAKWRPVVILAAASMATMFGEWAAFEANGVVGGWALTREEFAALTIVQQGMGLLFPIPFGVMMAASVKVSNYVGERQYRDAKRAAWLGMLLVVAWVATAAAWIFPLRAQLPHVFVSDSDATKGNAADILRDVVPWFFLWHVMDCCYGYATAMLKAVGWQRLGMAVALLSYWGLGLPLGWIMGIRARNQASSDDDPVAVVKWFLIGPIVGEAVGSLASVGLLCLLQWEAIIEDEVDCGEEAEEAASDPSAAAPIING